MGNWYQAGFYISFTILFLGFWIYCIATYGFLIGVGIGWLPALIAAGILSAVWPLLIVAALGLWMFLPSKTSFG